MKVLQYRKYDKKAEISIFISLLCVSVCAFIYVVIESAKMNATMFRVEALADTAVRSCFSEYCKPLYDKYGLLYVDTSYRGSDGGSSMFLNHIAAYISVNAIDYGANFSDIEYVDGLISDEIYADDNNYESLKKQIISVMKKEEYLEEDRELIWIFLTRNFEFEDDDEEISVTDITEEELMNLAVDNISKEMKANYSEGFDFSNLLESCETTIVLSGNEKEYEKNIKYSLFVQ